MILEKEIVKQIHQSLIKEELTSKRITRALRALEIGCHLVAVQACDLALRDCEVLEQRMAAVAIKQIAETRDAVKAKEFLKTIYDLEGDR